MCKISVIIPIYNVEPFVEECLRSVINQSLRDIEIICINDCGSDNSMLIVEKMSNIDNRIKIINHDINKGLPISRNTGIDVAKGDYIFFLDSDDYLKRDILEKLYNYAKNNCSDVVVSRGEAYTDSTDTKTLKRVKDLNKYLSLEEKENYKITKENIINILKNYPVVSWGALFNRKYILKNNLKFINQKAIYEDNGFFIKMLSTLPIISFLDITGVMYRIRSSSITEQNNKNENQKKINIKIVLEDAFEYIRAKHSKEYSKELINQIKNADDYCEYYSIHIKGFYTFIWGKKNKRIKILGFPIYRDKYNRNKRIIKLLGIPVYIKNVCELV